jgi:hypothetical protein
MAIELGWDPAKLSRIVNELGRPTAEDRKAIAAYLGMSEGQVFRRIRNRTRRVVGRVAAATTTASRTA